MSATLRWGIVSTGNIARKCVLGMQEAEHARPLAVASRSFARAKAFAAEHDIATAYGSYEELYADQDVDVIYIATPHPMHVDEVIRACEAGKHVLCEKPLGVNAAEAQRMVDAAQSSDVFFMEAFLYRFHPQTHRLQELIRSGAIGEVKVIDATYGVAGNPDPAWRLQNPDLAGGGILDVGCYPMSMVRLLAGAALQRPFADPIDVQGVGMLGATGVDDYASALLRFPGDILGRVHTAVRVHLKNAVMVFGTEGSIEVDWPWKPELGGEQALITVRRHGEAPKSEQVLSDKGIFALEVDAVSKWLADRQCPLMNWEDSLGNMRALDSWRRSIGLRYPMEGQHG